MNIVALEIQYVRKQIGFFLKKKDTSFTISISDFIFSVFSICFRRKMIITRFTYLCTEIRLQLDKSKPKHFARSHNDKDLGTRTKPSVTCTVHISGLGQHFEFHFDGRRPV